MKAVITVGILGILCSACDHNSGGPLTAPLTITAAQELANANLLAQSYGKGLRLMTVRSGDVLSDGTSEVWSYQYIDTIMPPSAYWFHATSSAVAFDSIAPLGVGSAVITHPWFDSDWAVRFSDWNGGSQFRGANPQYTIAALVGEPLIPNRTSLWWITYRSRDDGTRFLMLAIDANTAALVTRYP